VDQVFVFALAAALNPTLVAASTLMMLLPNPKRLMLGYLLGALMISITLGLVIVFSLESSDAVTTTENTLSPAATLALGGIALVAAAGDHEVVAELPGLNRVEPGGGLDLDPEGIEVLPERERWDDPPAREGAPFATVSQTDSRSPM
jgi:hypothetical protein